jgi:predicted metal-binding protein
MHDKKPKKIHKFTDKELKKDLEKYRQMALDLGMTDAAIIPADKVYVSRRVRAKCIIPKCPAYGSSAHCPPHSIDTKDVQEIVSEFKWAILVKLNVDSELVGGDDSLVVDEQGKIVPTKKLKKLLNQYRAVSDAVTRIEHQAFYDGHHLALSFAAGSCRSHYCNFQDCAVLKSEPCRFPGRARPSMESASMNVYKMVAEAGWDMYPIGMDIDPCNVPHATLVGIALID